MIDGGYDYIHREKVAKTYSHSLKTKRYLKALLCLHFLLWLLLLVKNGEALLDHFHVDLPAVLELYANSLPAPYIWEYLWLLSIFPIFLALNSMRRNRVPLMWSFFGLEAAFGFFPLIGTSLLHLPDLLKLLSTHSTRNRFLGFPHLSIMYVFTCLAAQLVGLELYLAYNLIQTWLLNASPSSTKTK